MAFRRLVGACLILIGISGQAYAECISPALAIKQMKAVEAFVVDDLKGKPAQPVVKAYNESPPASNTVADRVIIFYKDRAPKVAVALFNLGCHVGIIIPTVQSFLSVFPQYRGRLVKATSI